MAKPAATLNAQLSTYAGLALFASIHTGDTSTTGANEATGGSPAYARKSVTWGSPSAGTVSGGSVTFDIAAGTYTFIGFWSASTGGTFIDGYALNASVTAGSQTTLPVSISETQTS